MATLKLLLAAVWTSITVGELVTKKAIVTPDESSSDISIGTTNVETVTVDNIPAWKFETNNPDHLTDDEIATQQKGFDMEVVIGDEYGFNPYKESYITITLTGSTETKQCDMFLAFADADVDQYFAVGVQLDGEYSSTITPACGGSMAEGNPVDAANGEKNRWRALELYPNAYSLWAPLGEWPITVTLANYPDERSIFYYSDEENSQCSYTTAFSADTGLKLYIAGDGWVADSTEIFYIESITVSQPYCDTNVDWTSTYQSWQGYFKFVDPCHEGTSLLFTLVDITEYTSADETTEADKIYFTNGIGSWDSNGGSEEQYGEGEDAISARINDYTLDNDPFTLHTVTFLGTGNVNGRAVNIGTLKFSITLDNYDYSSESGDDAVLKNCFNIKVNDQTEELQNEFTDAYEFTLGTTYNDETFNKFRIMNERSATCTDSNGDETTIGVTAKRDGNVLCYTFERCDGVLFYDPFVYYEGDDADSKGIRDHELGFATIGFIITMIYNTLC